MLPTLSAYSQREQDFLNNLYTGQNCSFIGLNETCEGLLGKCTNTALEVLKGMNYALADDLRLCRAEVRLYGLNKWISGIMVLVIVGCFVDKFFLRKKTL